MGGAARVVVTGLGVMSGLGEDVDTFWSGLAAGRSCIGVSTARDPRIVATLAGEMPGFTAEAYLARTEGRHPARLADVLRRVLRTAPFGPQLTACAALQAFVDAGVEGHVSPERFAHVCAGQNLTLGPYAKSLRAFEARPDAVDPLLAITALDSDTAAVVSEIFELRGPTSIVGGACASGNLAVIAGLDLLRAGRADAVLVTGAPASFHSMILHAWTMIEAVSFQSFNDAPARASRPFDARREGFVPSEGAAAVVLESLDGARRRGARVRGEVLGGASTSDACRLPKPHADGQIRAMRGALDDGRVAPESVDYVNAHATSTVLGDAVEVSALRGVFGERAAAIPINSTKSMIGHGLTSAGVLELAATLLQMEHGLVHPTINQEEPDPALGLDFVPNVGREHRITRAISNSFGFGGINSCVVVGAVS